MTFRPTVEPRRLTLAREAGLQAARYLVFDPRYWIEQASLAGVRFELLERGGFVTNCVDADFEVAVFLEGWLDGTGGAASRVEHVLRGRAEPRHLLQ